MNTYKKSELIEVFEVTKAIIDHGIISKISDINITTGILIIGDYSYGIAQNNELLEKFPIGIFPVYYYRYINAGTLIMFNSSQSPKKWKIAKYFTSASTSLKTFQVETGDYVYVDKEGLDTIIKNENNKVYVNSFKKDEIQQRFNKNKDVLHFDIPIANSSNNLILMHTEWGDDSYSSYIGYDDNNIPVCLFTSLGPAKF